MRLMRATGNLVLISMLSGFGFVWFWFEDGGGKVVVVEGSPLMRREDMVCEVEVGCGCGGGAYSSSSSGSASASSSE